MFIRFQSCFTQTTAQRMSASSFAPYENQAFSCWHCFNDVNKCKCVIPGTKTFACNCTEQSISAALYAFGQWTHLSVCFFADPVEELYDSSTQTATNSAAELLKQGAGTHVHLFTDYHNRSTIYWNSTLYL